MANFNNNYFCIVCDCDIDYRVFNYSLDHFYHPMCRNCQDWFKDILDFTTATNESIDLFFALKRRGIPAELEKNDGYKTIDIAVPQAKVNIEVDGGHHNFSAKQAMSDLNRTLFSFKKGYYTLRIPNSLVRYHLEDTADKIDEFLIVSRRRILKNYR